MAARNDPSTDPAIVNIPLVKRYRGGLAAIDRELERYVAAQRCEERRQMRRMAQERRSARETAEKARRRFTSADVADAVVVRDQFGWHQVVRVNAKSVTVKTAHSWDNRIPLDQIREVRR